MINWAYAHLYINHFPIVLGLIGALGAVLALVMQRRTVWLFAVACLTLAGLFAQPVVMTGETAEEVMRTSWYVSRDALREHEQAGEWARWALLVSGVASAVAWFYLVRAPRTTVQQRAGRPGEFPALVQMLVVVSALVSTAVTLRAGWLGGRLVHHSSALSQPGPPGPLGPAADSALAGPVPTLPAVTAPLPAAPDSARRADSVRAAADSAPRPRRRRARRAAPAPAPDTAVAPQTLTPFRPPPR